MSATELPVDHPPTELLKKIIPEGKIREGCIPALAGDVNIFLGKESELSEVIADGSLAAEINIMIAEKGS